MAKKLLESSALSAFCESMALMLSAGIQMDEAVSMLAENMKDTPFKRACDDVFVGLSKGEPLATAMEVSSAFPAYAVETIAVGEKAGRLEAVLRALGSYYDEEDRLFRKIRTSIGHPAALLWVMVIILAFTVFAILPVFGNMYRSFAGGRCRWRRFRHDVRVHHHRLCCPGRDCHLGCGGAHRVVLHGF